MELELVCHSPDGQATALLVATRDGARVRDLRLALAAHLGLAADRLYAGPAPLPDGTPVAAVGLVNGANVGLGRPVQPVMSADAALVACGERELAVVGGLRGGAVRPITPAAQLRLGRRPDADLVLTDPEVSREHALVTTSGTGQMRISDHGSRNGVRRRGWLMDGDAELEIDEVVRLGETVVGVRERIVADADVTGGADGWLRFNRPPRIVSPRPPTELVIPVPPTEPRGFRFPWVTVLIPLLLGGVLYLIFPRMGYFLIFMVFSPLMVVANLIGDRRSGRKEYLRHKKVHDTKQAEFQAALAATATSQERIARAAHPDPSAVVTIACGPSARLWERRRRDQDFLMLRVGLVDQPAVVSMRPDPKGPPGGYAGVPTDPPAPPMTYDIPITVELTDVGVLGIASTDRAALLASARAVVAQAAVLHSPSDLGLVVISGLDGALDWEWASWLPHTRSAPETGDCARTIAVNGEQAETRLAELRALVQARTAERGRTLRAEPSGDAKLVVLDGARRLRDLPGLGELLATGPQVGVYALCLDTEATALPDECMATLVITSPSGTRATLHRRGFRPAPDVLIDGLSHDAATTLARALAPMRILGTTGGEATLPGSVRFSELAGLPLSGDPRRDAELVARRWATSRNGRCTAALLGTGPAGPVVVDLRRDGPHALVAGTSGAGKSELLQTLVASLALANSPDALTFVLVDYKGGSAFAACADLPHCVGLVTDLDGHLVARALESLSAELRRRELLLAQAEAKDIEDYWARTDDRLPRLLIVVDEFASLVEEVPEFVPGVVGIGMRGRSLGVHVVLATQRPGGVVNADLRANLNLRICLRVTAETESQDVLDAPDAARIPPRLPGRAFVRTGHSELTCMQSARIGWPRRLESAAGRPAEPVIVTRREMTDLGRRLPSTAAITDDVDADGCTDLSVLVAAARVAARRAGVERPPRPWLPPLPEIVTVAELPRWSPTSPVSAPLGLADLPDAQSQDAFTVDLEITGPIAVAGSVRTGRSTALRTLAAGLATGASPADVHLYAVDCGNRALSVLSALPHVGAVVDGDDPVRLARLLDWLDADVRRRQRLLATGGHGSLAEQRAAAAEAADRLPYLVLLVDRLESFVGRYADLDGGRLLDVFEGLLRRGPAVGLLAVLATDRTGFTHRIASAVEHRFVLRQADDADAAAFGVSPRQLPGTMPAGRGIWVATGQEIQVALLNPTATGSAEASEVERLGRGLHAQWDRVPSIQRARRVDPLPDRVNAADAAALRTSPRPDAPTVCTPGVGGDHLAPIDVDLAACGGAFLVAGPARSGRSTALITVARSLAGAASGELEVILLAPRPSPLRDLDSLPGVRGVITSSDPGEALIELEDLLTSAPEPTALVVDDGELVGIGQLADRLEDYVRGCRDERSLLVAAATTEDLLLNRYRGWLAAARRTRSGLLLNPASHLDGEVFDLRLPRSVGGGWLPGRALLVVGGAVTMVQVPIAAEPAGVR